ncbi:MAG: diadenylate cyclase CdaA [Firmicutes bacterium]|nr:diadenylate cyclase CdaA [Bacillota bacterium]
MVTSGFSSLQEILTNAFSGFGLTDAIDIALVAFVVYKILGFIVQTRAEQILKGVLVLIIALLVSDFLNLYTLNWMCKGAVALGAVAILIVFQPELRRALEYMGRGSFMRASIAPEDKEKLKKSITRIARATEDFSADRLGALLVFEGQTVLEDIAESGTVLDAEISEQLLGNIFYEGSPLHDGAVIIRDGKIHAAGCVLPLTRNLDIDSNLGTRHRAGIGITENSDALVIIVSEETGIISMARDGKLERFVDSRSIEKSLLDFYLKSRDLSDRIDVIPWAKELFGRKKGRDDDAEE